MFFWRKTGQVSWIMAFLGNPGSKYEGTRHNAGFMAADKAAEKVGVKIDRLKFDALTAVCSFGGEKVMLLKPQTYMNLSGGAVHQAMSFYRIPLDHIIVFSDDISLPTGKIRIRRSGSAGGHNGLKDIIEKCGGDGFPRIKIGVGSPPNPEYDMADWVLAKLRGHDMEAVSQAAGTAVLAAEEIITNDIDSAMNRFN